MDKWDYLRSPIMKKNFVSCFDIGEVSRRPGKCNWNWLYFLPFIFTFEQCATSNDSLHTYYKVASTNTSHLEAHVPVEIGLKVAFCQKI